MLQYGTIESFVHQEKDGHNKKIMQLHNKDYMMKRLSHKMYFNSLTKNFY